MEVAATKVRAGVKSGHYIGVLAGRMPALPGSAAKGADMAGRRLTKGRLGHMEVAATKVRAGVKSGHYIGMLAGRMPALPGSAAKGADMAGRRLAKGRLGHLKVAATKTRETLPSIGGRSRGGQHRRPCNTIGFR